jgi:glycine betaine/proline transport system permease protein
MENMIPKIPLDKWIEVVVAFLIDNFEGVFDIISNVTGFFVDILVSTLTFIPSIVLIALLVAVAWRTSGWRVASFTGIGLLLILNLGYWEYTLDTIALVLTAVLISVVVGVPLGIWSARSDSVKSAVTPGLDFMQTMPAFVYLIPAIFFFGLGVVPGVFASVIFAMPPTIRLTSLGIRQLSPEVIEAADAFGSNSSQKLFKVQLPLAMPTIMAGINQSIMLALSMVVIASMIGAPGLGTEVYRAVTQLKVGMGFEAGLAIVIIAIVLDRISQNIGKKQRRT